MSVEDIYRTYILPLSATERLHLLELTAHGLAHEEQKKEASLLDLEGLGAELWVGIDAQEYVNQLRNEWDSRP